MSELNVHEAITSGQESEAAATSAEPYRDPGKDTPDQIIRGILAEDASTPTIASGLETAAEPADASKAALIGVAENLSAALTIQQAQQESQAHDASTRQAASRLEEALTFGDPEELGPAAIALRQLNPEAFEAVLEEHRQAELDERGELLDFTGNDGDFAQNYEALTAELTQADLVAQAAETIQAQIERQQFEQEHARLSAELSARQHAVRMETMQRELGTTDLDELEARYVAVSEVSDFLRSNIANAVEAVGGDVDLAVRLAQPLDSIDPASPELGENVRALREAVRQMASSDARDRIVKSFEEIGTTTISEGLTTADSRVAKALEAANPQAKTFDAQRLRAAMKAEPRAPLNASQVRADVASQGTNWRTGLTRNGKPIDVDDATGARERKALEDAIERQRARSVLG